MAMQRLAPAATIFALAAVGVTPAFAQQAPVVRGTAAEMRVLRPLGNEVIAPSVFFLELSFQSRTASGIRAAELHVDGVRWARRDFDSALAKYVLSFEVDGRSLAAGAHKMVVKLFAADGSVAEAEVPVQVDGPAPSAPSAPVRSVPAGYGPEMAFRSLPRKLTGTVEIGISVKEENLNPYISFFVDKQFKTLKNYPPYSFVWDTTTVPNGYHVVEATGYLESSNATSTQRVQVYVDNPGGFTPKAAPDAAARVADPKPAAKAAPFQPTVAPAAVAARLSVPARAAGEGMPVAVTALADPASVTALASADLSAVAPGGFRTLAVNRNRMAPAAETRVDGVGGMGLSAAPAVARITSVGRPTAVSPATPAVAAALGPVRRATTSPAPRKAAPAGKALAALPELAPRLMVAFDGIQIAFDVAPRIEDGLPLAPFRQIFEHTGGTVTWAHRQKTVRAVNTEREVIFKVGAPSARVNGEAVSLDRNSYIDRGRAIVPLSFVGKALDVDIDFDPVSGRLQINSKK